MKKSERNESILITAAGFILLSIMLIVIMLLGILFKISPVIPAKVAVIATIVIVIIHLIVFISYVKFILSNKQNNKNKKGEYIGVSLVLAFLGLLYLDSAFAALENRNIFAAVFMFISSFCDYVASILTIVLYFLKPQKVNKHF